MKKEAHETRHMYFLRRGPRTPTNKRTQNTHFSLPSSFHSKRSAFFLPQIVHEATRHPQTHDNDTTVGLRDTLFSNNVNAFHVRYVGQNYALYPPPVGLYHSHHKEYPGKLPYRHSISLPLLPPLPYYLPKNYLPVNSLTLWL